MSQSGMGEGAGNPNGETPNPFPAGGSIATAAPSGSADDRWRLNGLAVLIVTFALLIAVGVSRGIPGPYFSYSELVSGYSEVSPWAVLLRFAIPFVICGLAVLWDSVGEREATTAALLTSLLLVWPTILAPEQTLESELYSKRYLLYIVYALFGAAFTMIGQAGARISHLAKAHPRVKDFFRIEREKLRDTIRDLLVGLIGAAIYSFLQTAFSVE